MVTAGSASYRAGRIWRQNRALCRTVSDKLNSRRATMIGQKTIHSFFTPVSKKRSSSEAFTEAEGCRGEITPVKKSRHPEDEQTPAVVSPPLSPEQLDRIQRNKAAALQKLAARHVPEGFGDSWRQELLVEFTKPYFTKVKVVILGQDPYHGPNQAHGLCFSVQKPVSPPPSLENMYKELQTDIEGFVHPGHGDLTGWAKQGVLLLNAVLTVRAHNANSHKDRGWEQFTDSVVSWLNKNLDGLVFMLWGAYAQKKGISIDRKRHLVLQTVHPSPLSAHRGFFGCRHFSKTNSYLEDLGKKAIDWKAL
ncbi:uracil-DNA glycosylase isoform X2 [Dendrobates tinctorius]|uniref:uracil-DNA glycosylase isoform X2 n=1 Tax=Dendrobates tinctorius TaxID=92724 RepID=UPI003CC9E54F